MPNTKNIGWVLLAPTELFRLMIALAVLSHGNKTDSLLSTTKASFSKSIAAAALMIL